MKTLIRFAMAALVALPVLAADRGDDQDKLQRAEQVLKAAIEAPDRGIPKELLEKAECIGIFPDVKKGAFIVGGEGGRGVFTCREKGGAMGAPAFFKMGGGSVGWQFGGEEADIVLLVMNRNGIDHLLQDRFTLGGEAAATAGPVGRTAKAATDAQLHAQLLSWSRSQGAFLGAALEGSVVTQDKDGNRRLYGKEVHAKEILVDHAVQTPQEARALLKSINQEAARG
jgi:lipid-binding SYLF domain-containing protein